MTKLKSTQISKFLRNNNLLFEQHDYNLLSKAQPWEKSVHKLPHFCSALVRQSNITRFMKNIVLVRPSWFPNKLNNIFINLISSLKLRTRILSVSIERKTKSIIWERNNLLQTLGMPVKISLIDTTQFKWLSKKCHQILGGLVKYRLSRKIVKLFSTVMNILIGKEILQKKVSKMND